VNRISLSLGLMLFFVAGCQTSEGPTSAGPPSVKVQTSSPVVRKISPAFEVTGQAEASVVFEARARVSGTLMSEMPSLSSDNEPSDADSPDSPAESTEVEKIEIGFEEGKPVRRGQKLFVIEPQLYAAEVDAARARWESAKAEAKLARATKNRTDKLYEKKTVTLSEKEQRDAEYAVAEAAVLREKAALDQALINYGYTTVESPIAGIAGEKLVDEGNIVGVGEFTLLTTVRKIDPLHIYFDVPERDVLAMLRKIAEGQKKSPDDYKVEIQFEGETGYPHSGSLELIDNQIDPNTGTALIRGSMPNEDRKIRPGAYAKLRIRDEQEQIEDAVLVHEIAINTDLSGKYILIVNDAQKIEQRRVRLGQSYQGFRHILAMWNRDETEPEIDGLVDAEFQYIHTGLVQARPGMTAEAESAPLEFPGEPHDDNSQTAKPADDPPPETDSETEPSDSGPPES